MSELLTKLSAYSSFAANWFNYQIRLIKVGVKRSNPLFVGIGSTRLFLAFVAVLAVLPQKDEGGWSWRVVSFLTSPSNEIGDTLAGIAGALAFLWIIVTVMLQSKELKAQREVLLLTKQEMAEQREATQDMARSMKAQAAVFEDEKAQRSEERAKNLLDSLLDQFKEKSLKKTNSDNFYTWLIDATPRYSGRKRVSKYDDCETPDSYFRKLRDQADVFERNRADCFNGLVDAADVLFRVYPGEEFPAVDLDDLIAILVEMKTLSKDLSKDQQVRLETLSLDSIHSLFGQVRNNVKEFCYED